MQHHELRPCQPLRRYVRLIWVLELDRAADFGPQERITPDGLLELVFHYGAPFACRYAGASFAPQPRSVAISQTRRFVEIRPEGPVGLISVRFQPWGSCHFLDRPLSEIADAQIPAADLWGRDATRLEERLREAPGLRERVDLVEDFLLDQLRRHRKLDVEPLVRAIWRRAGRMPIRELSEDLGIGERRLQRTFAAALGTTPKHFARLSRFLNACSLLRSGRWPGLADVGLACGYYDQSHFTADFKAFSGMTPHQFVAAARVSFLDIDA